MNLISIADHNEFKRLLSEDGGDTFFNKIALWKRAKNSRGLYGEDPDYKYENQPIRILLNYNYMRSWPITFTSESGEIDRQSVQMLVLKEDMRELNALTADGYFNYNPDWDRFIIDGLEYKPKGDTAVSQAFVDDIMFAIVITREETDTGEKR